MMEHKRGPCSVDLDRHSFNSLASKRQKADISISTKERKEKLSERIVALQQLVSPFGKTDTASVLLEAMEYIQFLHEQVKVFFYELLQHLGVYDEFYSNMLIKCVVQNFCSSTLPLLSRSLQFYPFQVLSAPYLQTMPTINVQEIEQYSLRSRGLCLVPISCTVGIAHSNGADIWAPIKAASPKFDKAISPFH